MDETRDSLLFCNLIFIECSSSLFLLFSFFIFVFFIYLFSFFFKSNFFAYLFSVFCFRIIYFIPAFFVFIYYLSVYLYLNFNTIYSFFPLKRLIFLFKKFFSFNTQKKYSDVTIFSALTGSFRLSKNYAAKKIFLIELTTKN